MESRGLALETLLALNRFGPRLPFTNPRAQSPLREIVKNARVQTYGSVNCGARKWFIMQRV
jgi:hypothetical protein